MAEFRLLQDRDKEQASALWHECFGDSDGFCRWFMSEQWNGEYSVAAVEEGKLVSMIHGRPYTLCIRGRGVPSVIMCGVATAPAYRHRGICGAAWSFLSAMRETKAHLCCSSPR